MTTFSDIAKRYLKQRGYEAFECASEHEARSRVSELGSKGKWPCYFFESNTTGEKDFEEFLTNDEEVNGDKFNTIGVIPGSQFFDNGKLDKFEQGFADLIAKGSWSKSDLLELYSIVLSDFNHLETGKYLDQRM